jgi:chromosomal replication initiator protein
MFHGPAGSGKTHLISALVTEVTRQCPQAVITVKAAQDLADCSLEGGSDSFDLARQCDLYVLEDLQHLPAWAAWLLAHLVDYLHTRQCAMVLTAVAGPRHLENLPARLVSRLVGGLVVGLEPLSAQSRLAVLQDKAQRRQLAIRPDVLAWLAEHLTGGGRQLEGAISRLEALARLQSGPLDLLAVSGHFQAEVEAGRPTVDRIARRVGGYFRVQPDQLQSRLRSRQVLLPRQIGMYLARQLTGLSLEQIGAYFGGRDHSTVLHACRKVKQTLDRDAVLLGAVRQMHAELA